MALPGPRPAAIPEGEEVPPAACNGEHRAPCGQDERAVSRLQRRHSDVRVYKEFCDFYIKFCDNRKYLHALPAVPWGAQPPSAETRCTNTSSRR
ncbi:LIM and senescent cell antigen-like-containing domain protein 4, partial [Eschrichtius robustus]|nr:LIM and senescent cell antigen-like-containing domain protein 4 [Eschrichtius robustus]